LLLSAATYRTAMPCRHDAQAAWLSDPGGRPAPDDSPDVLDDDCDDFEDVWIDELPPALLALKEQPR
ncbi:MAG: hypothetical protein QOF10_121, partial [Kribbellaceae bacterium]|nr:hypothetical protein [Kribbellaceae bacterium]